MSHSKKRAEKNCLNCNAIVADRFCGICGQENIEIKESFWGIVSHFFQDITHYDGKFLSTLKLLLTKPGFLSFEYLRGRRASYLHPIRLYVFTSAFFFLIYFTFYQSDNNKIQINTSAKDLLSELKNTKANLEKTLADSNNTDDKKELAKVLEDIALLEKDSTAKSKLKSVKYRFGILSLKNYETDKESITLSEYDSLQKVLPDSEKDGFIVNKFERQNLFLKEKYNGDGRQILNAIINNFKHRFPQMLFISLPLFALLLKLLYIRRKKYLYVSHIIFSIHLYCAVFIIILISLWISSLATYINHSLASYINTGLILCCFFYLYKAIRYFYEQRRAKTMFKYFLLLLGSSFLMMILFVIFFIFSTFTIK